MSHSTTNTIAKGVAKSQLRLSNVQGSSPVQTADQCKNDVMREIMKWRMPAWDSAGSFIETGGKTRAWSGEDALALSDWPRGFVVAELDFGGNEDEERRRKEMSKMAPGVRVNLLYVSKLPLTLLTQLTHKK